MNQFGGNTMIVIAKDYTPRHTSKTTKVDDELISKFYHQNQKDELYKTHSNLIIDESYQFFEYIEGEWIFDQISTSIPQFQPSSEHLIVYITKSQMWIKEGHKIPFIKNIKPNFEVITDITLNLEKTKSGLWLISLTGGDHE